MKKAEDVFKDYAGYEGRCVQLPSYKARFVKEGEHCLVPSGLGIPVEIAAEEDGWEIEARRGEYVFYNVEDFAEEFTPAKLDTSHAEELPEDAKVTPLSPGDSFIAFPFGPGLGVESTADENAFLVEFEDDAPVYINAMDFHVRFKTDLAKPDDSLMGLFNEKSALTDPEAKKYKYVVLKEDTEFDFADGPYTGKEGEVLYKNEEDIDGYTVLPTSYFARNFKVESLAKTHSSQDSRANLKRYLNKRR